MKITEKLGLKKPDPSDTFNVQDFNDNADILDKLWEIVYPVGAVYISTNAASPQDLFGGTWVQLENRFLLAAGNSYTAGNTGGIAAHTHTLSQANKAYADFIATGNVLYENYITIAARNMQLKFGFSTAQASYNADSVYAVPVKGTTDSGSNMPPYLVVYMWERTA